MNDEDRPKRRTPRQKKVTFEDSSDAGRYKDSREWVEVDKKHILKEQRLVCPECGPLAGMNLSLEETYSYFKQNKDKSYSCTRCGLVFNDKLNCSKVLDDIPERNNPTIKEKLLDFFQSGPQLKAVKGDAVVIKSMPASDVARILDEDLRKVKYALIQCEKDGICERFYKDIKNVRHLWVKSPYWQIEKKKI